TAKANLLFKKIIDWQNALYEQRNEKDCKIIYDEDEFIAYSDSQYSLNKIKRKFNKAFLEGLGPSQKKALAEEILIKKGLSVNKKNMTMARYAINHFGYSELCLDFFSEFIGHKLNSPIRPLAELVDVKHTKGVSHHFIMTVASTAAQAPLASNASKYRGQEKTPITDFCEKAWESIVDQLEGERAAKKIELNYMLRKNRWTTRLGMSNFRKVIENAKMLDESIIKNCGERADSIFYAIARERDFTVGKRCSIKENPHSKSPRKGDHVFVISNGRVLDAWNGARIYRESEIKLYLNDYFDVSSNGKACLRQFSPKKQMIQASAYTIYPCDAFEKDSVTKHPHLIQLLKQFHDLSDRNEKMLKALEIVSFIENRMPLYEFYDKAVHELYDQMVYLTKKERKKGLKFTPRNPSPCRINEALINLDKGALKKCISENERMNKLTIFHALKATLRSNDPEFYDLVSNANPPIETSLLTKIVDQDPLVALEKISERLFN
ncbi:MAG TPA: hypothetical protein VLE96_01360, partial [Chlamydiales bacterium]|nr:hypothetical protein [Chlamydiales bacterium]